MAILTLSIEAPELATDAAIDQQAQRYMDQGQEAYRKGHLAEATALYTQALERFEAIGDQRQRGICLTRLGLVYLDRGDYAAAQSYSERAIAQRSALGDGRGAAQSLNNLGLALAGQSRYGEALAALQKALQIIQQENDAQGTAIIGRNIGLVHFYSGQYREALKDYHQTLNIIEAHSPAEWSLAERWAVLTSLGAVYKKLGWPDKALRVYLDLLQTAAPDAKTRLYTWNNAGTIYRSLGDPIKAREFYERARQEAVRLENKAAEAMVLKNLGLVYLWDMQDNPAAVRYLTASLALSQSLSDRYEEANTYYYLGEAARRQGGYAAAQTDFERARALADELGFREAQWRARYGLGQLREAQGDPRDAQRYYEEAIAIIESTRAALGGESLRHGFLADKIGVFEAALRTLLTGTGYAADPSRIAKAFEYVERSKARAMLDLLGESAAHIEQGIPPDLRLRREQLRRELAQAQAARREAAPAGTASERRAAMERELEALDLRILESNPRYALIQESRIPTLAEVARELLDSETALVVFFCGQQSLYLWIVTQAGTQIRVVPNPAPVEARARAYLQQLNSPSNRSYLAPSGELCDTLFQTSLETLPPTITRLIIVPDGFLHTLPFETLQARPRPREPARRYLIERYEISYAPSAAVLAALRRVPGRSDRPEKAWLGLSVTGPEPAQTAETPSGQPTAWRSDEAGLDPLRFADEELLRIQKYVPGAKEVYRHGQSTKATLQRRSAEARFRVLHFATHSVIDEEVPESSFVLLSRDPERPDDTRLWLHEIFNLRLDADMIVLSSCRSGLGPRITGDGVIGFTRAFMYAGARSLVTTFWEIDDAVAPLFMEQFYFHLGRGASAADAMRRAKLRFLRSARYEHPFYWGAFAVTGHTTRSVYSAWRWEAWAIMALSLGVLAILVRMTWRTAIRKFKSR